MQIFGNVTRTIIEAFMMSSGDSMQKVLKAMEFGINE